MTGGQGAIYTSPLRCRFRVWAPDHEHVTLHIIEPAPLAVPLDPCERGYHEIALEGITPGTRYRYALGEAPEPLPDPASRWQPDGVHGDSAVFDPSAFEWHDAGWRAPPQRSWVIYELHVGTFTPEGTFDAAALHLDELAALGVTTIEIMPVAQFPGWRNWGYDGVFPFAPQNTYGGPAALQRFVDAAHRSGLAVILDVVYNHMGPEGNRLGDYGPYFTDTYRTPWGDAMNVDGAGSDEVRAFFIDNALMWITDFHMDGLRFDAIHGIFDTSASPFLAEMTDALHARAAELGREVVLIAESESNDRRVTTSTDRLGLGFDGQWSDDFHHAVHALLTGEDAGYYRDFGTIEDVATALRDGFVYAGRYSVYQQRRRGSTSREIPAERLVTCIQNHDQTGNRMLGDRLSTLVSFDKLKCAAGLMLLSPYPPMLFMGEEWGETNPFLYFVSHSDVELIEAVRQGRAEEFAAFNWSEDTPDPQSEQTFERSKLDRSKREHGEHRIIYAMYGELLRIRRDEPALAGRKDDLEVRTSGNVLSMRRWSGGSEAIALFNLGDDPGKATVGEGAWTLVVDSTDERLGGPGMPSGRGTGDVMELAPWSFALMVRDGARQ